MPRGKEGTARNRLLDGRFDIFVGIVSRQIAFSYGLTCGRAATIQTR